MGNTGSNNLSPDSLLNHTHTKKGKIHKAFLKSFMYVSYDIGCVSFCNL